MSSVPSSAVGTAMKLSQRNSNAVRKKADRRCRIEDKHRQWHQTKRNRKLKHEEDSPRIGRGHVLRRCDENCDRQRHPKARDNRRWRNSNQCKPRPRPHATHRLQDETKPRSAQLRSQPRLVGWDTHTGEYRINGGNTDCGEHRQTRRRSPMGRSREYKSKKPKSGTRREANVQSRHR